MATSERQRAANQRNAQRSTGPTSDAGKARSSRNATTHGLTARLPEIGPEAEQASAARLAAYLDDFAPREGWETWLVTDLAEVTLRLDRSNRSEHQARELAAERAASDLWTEDRRLEVETIAAGLSRQPARVVARLRTTSYGCDWLIERWTNLADAEVWTDELVQRAHDLLGIPLTERSGLLARDAAEIGPAALARREITRLETLWTCAIEADDSDRSAVATGRTDIPSRDVANLRRYQRANFRRLSWIMDQMTAAGLLLRPRSGSPAAPTPPLLPPPLQPARPGAPVAVPPAVPLTRVEPNEPIAQVSNDKTKPICIIPPSVLPEPIVSARAPRRPDLAKIAKRERKARRKQGQRRHPV